MASLGEHKSGNNIDAVQWNIAKNYQSYMHSLEMIWWMGCTVTRRNVVL